MIGCPLFMFISIHFSTFPNRIDRCVPFRQGQALLEEISGGSDAGINISSIPSLLAMFPTKASVISLDTRDKVYSNKYEEEQCCTMPALE